MLEITWGSAVLSLDLWEGDGLPLGHRAAVKEKVVLWGFFLFVCRDQEGIFMERGKLASADRIVTLRAGEA